MKRPKNTTKIIAKINKFLCPSGFSAITLFGIIYVRNEASLAKINKTDGIDSLFENHEMIHVKQAVSTHNSWFLFYLLYIWQWLMNLPMIFINKYAPYKFIPFELEAYANEANVGYQKEIVDGANLWRDFTKLTFIEKWKLAKQYYNGDKTYIFRDFVNKCVCYITKNNKIKRRESIKNLSFVFV